MRRMWNRATAFAALALMLCAGSLLAANADMSGKWITEILGPDGKPFPLTFEFQQRGEKLAGTLTGPQGDPLAIEHGTVQGNKFSFTISFGGMTITHQGTFTDAEIRMTTTSTSPGFHNGQMTLRRWSPVP